MIRQIVMEGDDVKQACLEYVENHKLLNPLEGQELCSRYELDMNDDLTGNVIVGSEVPDEDKP